MLDMHRTIMLSFAFFLSALAACTEAGNAAGNESCVPGRSEPCTCGNLMGAQVCEPDGTGFGECSCESSETGPGPGDGDPGDGDPGDGDPGDGDGDPGDGDGDPGDGDGDGGWDGES